MKFFFNFRQGHAKKETSGNSAQYGSIPVPSASSQETLGTFATSQSTPAAPKSEFVQQPAEAQRAILRPPQPPPPYPGLPPPYPGPGRQQQVCFLSSGFVPMILTKTSVLFCFFS